MINWWIVSLVVMGAVFIAALTVPASWLRAAWYWLLDKAFRGWVAYYLEQVILARMLTLDPGNRYLFILPEAPADVEDAFVVKLKELLGADLKVAVIFSDEFTVLEFDRANNSTV